MLARFAVSMLFTAAAVLAGCARPTTSPTAPIAKVPTARPAPVIVRIVSRHYSIVVSAGPTAPIYQVTNSAGHIVADGVTLAQLRLVDNNLYEELLPALAPNARVDARADAARDGDLLLLVDK
jgi:hypothetical protein